MIVKTAYIEPEDYFPKEIREKYKLGEYDTDEDDGDKTENESDVTEMSRNETKPQ